MNEELLQRDLIKNPEKIGTWNFYNIGATTVNALKEAGIIRSIDYSDVARKKVDAIITRQKEVIAIIEYKSPKQFNTKNKKDSAILQEIEVAKKLKTKLIIATDTQEALWINVATGNGVKDAKGNDFKYLFDPKDTNLQKIITEIIQSISDKNDKILPKQLIDPTSLAKQIWQDVWSVSGATPENCLYTFVELFIFKYLSDLNILKGNFSFDELLKNIITNEAKDVLQHYANVIRPKIKDKGLSGAKNRSKLDIKIFNEFINNWNELSIESEILYNQIIRKASIPEELEIKQGFDKNTETNVRINQNFFRTTVLSSYNNQCCITGLNKSDLLIASHIIPWSKDEKNRTNPQNGLCLNALHDKAFDRGLIGIDKNYKIKISAKIYEYMPNNAIEDNFIKYLEKEIILPEKFLPNVNFLDWHLLNIFLK